MNLFIAMLMGIIGTILIERHISKAHQRKILVPIRKDDYRINKHFRR